MGVYEPYWEAKMEIPVCAKSALLFASVASLSASLWGQAMQTNFRTDTQLVLIPVTVMDRHGKTIEGLRKENFKVFDDQMPQEIVSFATEEVPCAVALVLDISGSMRETLAAAKDIIRGFLLQSNPADEYSLFTVSSKATEISGFTTDIALLERGIDAMPPGGRTALIDTIYVALSRMRHGNRPRRALLVLSDGMDNHSRYSDSELMRTALEADVQIYTIIVASPLANASDGAGLFRPSLAAKPWDRARDRQGPAMLEKVSAKTGGLCFHPHNAAEAKNAAAKAAFALRSEYVIGYQPQQSGTSGKWHKLRVRSDVPGTNIYARNGYYQR